MVIHASSVSFSPPEYNVIKDVNSDIPLVLVTRTSDYTFNEELLSLDKYVLVNMSEFNWDFNWKYTPIFGADNIGNIFDGFEWERFNHFVKTKPPVLTLQREILLKDISDSIKPLSYPCYQSVYKTQTKEEFNSRPIELMHYWGRSSEERMRFQGKAYKHATKAGIDIVDNLYYLQGFLNENKNRIWITTHIPHFARIPIEQVMNINGISKLALSMPGCGKHCFRDAEVPVNSVMVLQDNDVAFPIGMEWEHGVNCIRYEGENPIPAIEKALQRDDLYEIYLRGLENIDKYRPHNYNKYIENLINN